MLKDLDKITELSENFALMHGNYRQEINQLITKINDKIRASQGFGELLVNVTDAGEFFLQGTKIIRPRFEGAVCIEQITLSPEVILLLAKLLEDDVL